VTITERIRRQARELGFELVGICPATPLEGAAFYARWLARGFVGQLEYLERNLEKRADPQLLVPGARSVICLGMNYYQPTPENADPLRGLISCYARGDDYHELLKGRLRLLWSFIEQQGGPVKGRYYTDTGPVLERELACRAGLGWRGKNTCLINKRLGSFFFLGEIILDLELDFDRPAAEHCGACTRCREACPTGALIEPYLLDVGRCISYLTIELKDAIPLPLRPTIGNQVFGCDLCQQVCPWNRQAALASEPAFHSRPGLTHLDLIALLSMVPEAFNDQFRSSPIQRTGLHRMRRNAAVALGNCGDRRAVPALIQALGDEDPQIRGHSAWALGQLGGKVACQGLEKALSGEQSAEVIEELRQAWCKASATA